MGAGLISPIDAMQILHAGIDEATAREMLLKIRREREPCRKSGHQLIIITTITITTITIIITPTKATPHE